MKTLQVQALTLLTTLIVGAGLAALGLHVWPPAGPPLARVDLASLVTRQQQAFIQRVKPGMAADEEQKLFEEARAFGLRLDTALEQVAQECHCALINSAALLKTPPDSAIPDLSARVAQIVRGGAGGGGSSAK